MRREKKLLNKLKTEPLIKQVLKIKTWWVSGNNGEANAAHRVLSILAVWE